MMLGLARYGELTDINGQPTGETGYAWVGYGDYNIKLVSRQGSNGVTPPDGCRVQSVYINEEGEEVCSEILMSGDSGINSPKNFREELSRTYYNLQGHAVDSSYNGPAICRIVYSDGTVKTIKMMRAGR